MLWDGQILNLADHVITLGNGIYLNTFLREDAPAPWPGPAVRAAFLQEVRLSRHVWTGMTNGPHQPKSWMVSTHPLPHTHIHTQKERGPRIYRLSACSHYLRPQTPSATSSTVGSQIYISSLLVFCNLGPQFYLHRNLRVPQLVVFSFKHTLLSSLPWILLAASLPTHLGLAKVQDFFR